MELALRITKKSLHQTAITLEFLVFIRLFRDYTFGACQDLHLAIIQHFMGKETTYRDLSRNKIQGIQDIRKQIAYLFSQYRNSRDFPKLEFQKLFISIFKAYDLELDIKNKKQMNLIFKYTIFMVSNQKAPLRQMGVGVLSGMVLAFLRNFDNILCFETEKRIISQVNRANFANLFNLLQSEE